jgi:Tol biopolymer transport system component
VRPASISRGRSSVVGPALIAVGLVGGIAACGSDDGAEQPDEVFAPRGPFGADVFLADLTWDVTGRPSVSPPANLTQRPGYDNQPRFLPDGSGLWYTAVDDFDGQADIWRYDLNGGMVTRVTMSNPESEYSATPLPDGSGISAIRVEADSTQRLWRFDGDGSGASVVFPEVAPVGYHAWADQNTVIMFVLGDPPTLRRGDVRSGEAEVVAEDIGRSIQRIPDSNDVSYVQRHEDGSSTVMRLPGDGSAPAPVIEGVAGGDFHAWAPNGTLLMAHEAVIYALPAGSQESWEVVADFTELHITISRLAVSADGSQIALVGEPDMLGELPGS